MDITNLFTEVGMDIIQIILSIVLILTIIGAVGSWITLIYVALRKLFQR